ncbi:MAG: alginate export family protein [Planctomycetota bacterium]
MKRSLAFIATALVSTPLLAQGDNVVTFNSSVDSVELGGSLRFRTETRDPSGPMTGLNSMSHSSGFARVFFAVNASENLDGKVEFQHVIPGQGLDSESLLRQAWLRWGGVAPGTDLQVGRFQMRYGNQRMVSDLAWSNFGRAWDGARISHAGDGWNADVFWTQPVEMMGIAAGSEQAFGGAYVEVDPSDNLTFDVYAFMRRDRMMAGTGTNDLTFGGIVEGRAADNWTFSVEAAAQSGDHGALDAAGTAFALRTDVEVAKGVKLGLGYELASGDGNATDGDDDSFKPLFDFGHTYHGTQDLFRWSNLQDIVFRSSFDLDGNWVLLGDLHIFSLDDAAGGIAAFTGAPFAQVAGEDELGTELDVAVKGVIAGGIKVWAGISYFSAGDAIASNDDQLWAFLQGELFF